MSHVAFTRALKTSTEYVVLISTFHYLYVEHNNNNIIITTKQLWQIRLMFCDSA